jgi:hypothetical protein
MIGLGIRASKFWVSADGTLDCETGSKGELQLIVLAESVGFHSLAPQVSGKIGRESVKCKNPLRPDLLHESYEVLEVGMVAKCKPLLVFVCRRPAPVQRPAAE